MFHGTAEAVVLHASAVEQHWHALHLGILLGLKQTPCAVTEKKGLYGIGGVLHVVMGGDGIRDVRGGRVVVPIQIGMIAHGYGVGLVCGQLIWPDQRVQPSPFIIVVFHGVAVQVCSGERLAETIVVRGSRTVAEDIFGADRICVYDGVVFVGVTHPLSSVVAGHPQRVHTSINIMAEVVSGYRIATELLDGDEIT